MSYGGWTLLPSLTEVLTASLVLMAIFVYKNCESFPISCACLVLKPLFTARNGDSMSLTKLICRDGSFLYPVGHQSVI